MTDHRWTRLVALPGQSDKIGQIIARSTSNLWSARGAIDEQDELERRGSTQGEAGRDGPYMGLRTTVSTMVPK